MLASERGGGVWIWTFLIGELCLVPESFLCRVPDLFRDPGTDSDLESGGVGVERAEAGALTACWGRTGATLNWFNNTGIFQLIIPDEVSLLIQY